MGPQEDYIETIVTCEGDFYDPEFHSHLDNFSKRLQDLIETGQRELIVKKVEPWNSVRVTFNIPKEAAVRLKQLAESGNQTLRELGVLAVQVEGDRLISLTIAGKNNERTELVLQTTPGSAATTSASRSVFDLPSSDELGVPGPSNVETTRKNIAQYLQGGPAFKNLFNPMGLLESIKPPESVGVPAAAHEGMGMPSNHPMLKKFPFSMPGPGLGPPPPGMEHMHFPPGSVPSGFPSPAMLRSQFSSPNVGHNQSPLSPNYPTPPPSVSNPSSPGLRTANFPVSMAGSNSALLNNRDITSSSPLLVNLLQNDVAGLGHVNNFMPNKLSGMPFPPLDIGPPPPKKRRKPRKPKDGTSKASKSPAGQEAFTGFPGTSSGPHGTPGHLRGPPPGFHPGLTHMPEPQQPSDISGQHMTQEPASHASTTSQSNSSMALITSTETMMAAAQMSSQARMQPPSRSLQTSPGRALSPRAQSPVRAQSPGRSKSPGAFMLTRGPGGNPQHIVNPVTGKLEPATSPDLARMRAMTKEQTVDSDDMAHTQLQPPPNPLVMLQKNIAASTDSAVVSSLSTVSSRQSSPLPVTTPSLGHSSSEALVRTEHSLMTARYTMATSNALDARSIPGFGKSVPSSELVHTQLVSSNVTNMAAALQNTRSPATGTSPVPHGKDGLSLGAGQLATTVPSSISAVTVLSHVSDSTTTLSTVLSSATTNSTVGIHRVPMASPIATSTAIVSTTAISHAVPKVPSRTTSPIHVSSANVGTLIATTVTTSYNISSLPLPAQHCTSSPSTTHPHPHPSADNTVQSTSAPDTVASQSADLAMSSVPSGPMPCSDSSADRYRRATPLTVVSSGMTSPLMSSEPIQSNPIPVNNAVSVNSSSGTVAQDSVDTSDSPTHSSGDTDTSDKSDVKVNSELCNSSPIANTEISASQDITKNGSLEERTKSESRNTTKESSSAVIVPSVQASSGLDAAEKSPMQSESTDSMCMEHPPKEDAVIGGMRDGQPMNAIETGQMSNCSRSTDLLLSREDSGSQGTNDPASTNTSPDHEHCVTDSSDTSSLVAHSQGKDSGIADMGKLGYLDKGDDSQGVGSDLHTARSNGAATSEATASPLSETDTVSSGHLSQSPSVQSASVGLPSHDSELSSHSFEDQNHESCHVPNAHGSLGLDGVPKLSNATSSHGSLKDARANVDLSHHGPATTCTDNNAVITVGYALSRDQPSVNLSQCGLSDKSLPFLTKPSNPFTKERSSSVGLEGYVLSERFPSSSTKVATEPLSWSTKKEFLTAEVPHGSSQHSNSNGDMDNKDYLNWSKTLNLPPKLLEKVDITPPCFSTKVGSSSLCEVGSEAGLVMGSEARTSINGDDTRFHSSGSLYASLSLETGMSRLARHGNLECHTKCPTTLKDTRFLSNHAHGLLPHNNVKVQINSGLEKAFKRENHVALADSVHSESTGSVDITGTDPETKAERAPVHGGKSVPGASGLLAVQHESQAAPPPPLPLLGKPAPCGLATDSTSPSSASTLSPTSTAALAVCTPGTMAAEVTVATSASSPGVPAMDAASSPSQGVVMTATAGRISPNRSVAVASSGATRQTLANTFGASMVTAVITSTVPMGSAITVTSFSNMGTHPSSAMIPITCIPVSLSSHNDVANTTSVLSPVSEVQAVTSCVTTPTEQLHLSATRSTVTTEVPMVSGAVTTQGHEASNLEPQQLESQAPVRPTTCPVTKSCRTVSELLAHRSSHSSVASIHHPIAAIANLVISNHLESQAGELTPSLVHFATPFLNDHCSQISQGDGTVNCVSQSQVAEVSLPSTTTPTLVPVFPHSLPSVVTVSKSQQCAIASSHCDTTQTQCVQQNRSVEVSSSLTGGKSSCTQAPHQEHVPDEQDISKDEPGYSLEKAPCSQQDGPQNDQEIHHHVNHHGTSAKLPDHAADRSDAKSSRGISIMKPLYDREFEIEEELQSQVVGLPSKKPEAHLVEVTPNPVPVASLPKSKMQPTVAQILEEADKVRRSQAQMKHNALLMHKVQVDGVKQEVGATGDATFSVFQNRPAKATLIPGSMLSSPVPKMPNASFDLSRNTHSHIAMNFVQKSLQTPPLYNSTPHPITSPGFAHNLTDSVQKIMNAIPRTDTTPPPSPACSKVSSTNVPPALNPPRQRQKSISPPAVDLQVSNPASLPESPVATQDTGAPDEPTVSSVQALTPAEDTVLAVTTPLAPSTECTLSESTVSSVTEITMASCASVSDISGATPSAIISDVSSIVPEISRTTPELDTKTLECSSNMETKALEVVTTALTCTTESVTVEASTVQRLEPLPAETSPVETKDTVEKPEQSSDTLHVYTDAPTATVTPEAEPTLDTKNADIKNVSTEDSESEMAASEHSYSARPPGCTLSPSKIVSPAKQPALSDQPVQLIPSVSTHPTEEDQANNAAPSVSIPGAQYTTLGLRTISPAKLVVDTNPKTVLAAAVTPGKILTSSGTKMADSSRVSPTFLAGVAKAADVATTSVSGSRLRVISPISKITTGPKDDAEGPRTLVIKIIGAHSASKDNPMVKTVVKPESKPALNHPIPRISHVQHGMTKESSIIDLSSLGKFQQITESDQTSASTAKRKLAESFTTESKTEDPETTTKEATMEKPAAADPPSEAEESANVPSSIDEIFSVVKKRRTPSCDAMSETSSVDMPVIRGRPGGSTERGDSPLPRSTRMSTRNNGRRRNSPSDSSTDEKSAHATRASKRKITVTDDDSSQGVTEKKVARLEQVDAAPDQTSENLLESSSQDPAQNDTGRTVSPSSFYNKVSPKVTTPTMTKTPNNVNNARVPTPPPATEERGHGKGRKTGKADDSVEVKEENGAKRNRAKTNSVSAVADVEEQEFILDDGLFKDEAAGDHKGKRTTRSSKNKEHCELPNAIQGKRRRTSRDHR